MANGLDIAFAAVTRQRKYIQIRAVAVQHDMRGNLHFALGSGNSHQLQRLNIINLSYLTEIYRQGPLIYIVCEEILILGQ